MASAEKGTSFKLLNYVGELFTADPLKTPFLTATGGLTGGKVTQNVEFPCSVEAAYPTATQPSISEDTSKTAPAETDIVNTQVYNVVGINQYAVEVTYFSEGNKGRLSGVATYGGKPLQVVSDYDVQIARHLTQVARDTEVTFLTGTYVGRDASGTSATATASRGLIECASDASNTVAAGGDKLSKDLLNSLILAMVGHGAFFGKPVLIMNAFQNQRMSEIYGYAPASITIGGVALQAIHFDIAGLVGIMFDPFQTTSVVTLADLSVCAPVFMEIPDKGLLFYEPLAKLGAAERGQVYGCIGLDHGPKWCHGTITGLATS